MPYSDFGNMISRSILDLRLQPRDVSLALSSKVLYLKCHLFQIGDILNALQVVRRSSVLATRFFSDLAGQHF